MSGARDELYDCIARSPSHYTGSRLNVVLSRESVDAVVDAILANPDVVLRALGGETQPNWSQSADRVIWTFPAT